MDRRRTDRRRQMEMVLASIFLAARTFQNTWNCRTQFGSPIPNDGNDLHSVKGPKVPYIALIGHEHHNEFNDLAGADNPIIGPKVSPAAFAHARSGNATDNSDTRQTMGLAEPVPKSQGNSVSSGGAHAEREVGRAMVAATTDLQTARQSGPLERTLQVAIVASAAFDASTTVHNLRNGCSENNPLMGSHPSTAKVVAFEAGWTTGELAIAHFLHRHHPKIAAVLLGESTIEHGVAGGLNTTQKCF